MPSCVFGIGSYSYQYNMRGTFGFAIKATAGVVDGELIEIFKDPVTDHGLKKSAKGLLAVQQSGTGEFELVQEADREAVRNCVFERVFLDGALLRDESLEEIRGCVRKDL